MSEDVKIEVIRNTQDSLSKYIKKPPLTEKLLRKPPFRYLHDITTAVMRETGFLQGLYSQDELNPENIKDREAKIAFLEKLIAAVNLSTGMSISARPNKIVAGLDVAKTNELLQTIAKALEKNVDSSQAVEQILKNKKGLNQQAPTKKEISKTKTSKEGKTAETKTREPRNSDVLKKKPKDSKSKTVTKPEPKKEKSSKDVSQVKNGKGSIIEESSVVEKKSNTVTHQENSAGSPPEVVEHSVSVLSSQTSSPPPPQQPPASPEQSNIRNKPLENIDSLHTQPETKVDVKNEGASTSPEEELKRPQSARAVHRRKPGSRKPIAEAEVNEAAPETKEAPQMEKPTNQFTHSELRETKRPRTAARPASARPGAPRVRDRGTVLLANKEKDIGEPVNVIVDSKDLPKDDDETLVKVEAAPSLTEANVDQLVDENQFLTRDQGHLVSQILETQKELEDPTASLETTSKLDIRRDKALGGKENVHREIEKLQAAIQALTQAANPLGKLIDFLQEDVDSMQTELETWVFTNRDLAKHLQAEERLTEQSIEPLARQLEDINQLIEEQLEETSIVKAAVIRNDERLARLLHSGSSHRVF